MLVTMRIGELSARTGVPTRMLRYYEEQGLLESARRANGYRDYAEGAVDRVGQVRGLIESGVPTAIIARLVPCLDGAGTMLHEDCPDILASLEEHRAAVDRRIASLSRSRDAITDYLRDVRVAVAATHGASA